MNRIQSISLATLVALALPNIADAGKLRVAVSGTILSESGTRPQEIGAAISDGPSGDLLSISTGLLEPATQVQPYEWHYLVDPLYTHAGGQPMDPMSPHSALEVRNDAPNAPVDSMHLMFHQRWYASTTYSVDIASDAAWLSSADLRTMVGTNFDLSSESGARITIADSLTGYTAVFQVTAVSIHDDPVGTFVGAFCFGDGTANASNGPINCPCQNNSAVGAGEGCINSQGHGAILTATGTPVFAANNLGFSVTQARPNQPAMLVQGGAATAFPFKDGVMCTGNPAARAARLRLNSAGSASTTSSVIQSGSIPGPGVYRVYQAWYRDPGLAVCGRGSNFTNAIAVTFI